MVLTVFMVASLLFVVFEAIPSRSEAISYGGGDEPSVLHRYAAFINDISPVSFARSSELHPGWNSLFTIDVFSGSLHLKYPYLGRSSHDRRGVNDLIWDGLPETLVLVFSTLLFTGLIGIPLGILAARSRNGLIDRVV